MEQSEPTQDLDRNGEVDDGGAVRLTGRAPAPVEQLCPHPFAGRTHVRRHLDEIRGFARGLAADIAELGKGVAQRGSDPAGQTWPGGLA
ncbi:hypothetical protein ACIOD2_46990 [Amycolatopsis sp. NPDC088138]|uniref:hypothetical protein n=1 Tax=Amycolatopsis sp. NPDC088138 TaxID=3363938 RepID=UPI003811ADD7